jgi:serine/threonine-protein kinase RsbT
VTEPGSVEELPIRTGDDVVRVRQLVRIRAQAVKLSLVDQTKLVTAASELARNTLVYGGSGSVRVQTVARNGRQGICATFTDKGPGIADVEQALTDGWTSGDGLGLGLSGSRRLVDEFEIDTEVGRGTVVTVVKWTR